MATMTPCSELPHITPEYFRTLRWPGASVPETFSSTHPQSNIMTMVWHSTPEARKEPKPPRPGRPKNSRALWEIWQGNTSAARLSGTNMCWSHFAMTCRNWNMFPRKQHLTYADGQALSGGVKWFCLTCFDVCSALSWIHCVALKSQPKHYRGNTTP